MGKKLGYNQRNFEFKNGKIIHVAQKKAEKYHKIWLGFMDEDGLSSATFLVYTKRSQHAAIENSHANEKRVGLALLKLYSIGPLVDG